VEHRKFLTKTGAGHTYKYHTCLKRLSRGKHSSLFCHRISDGEKKFYHNGPKALLLTTEGVEELLSAGGDGPACVHPSVNLIKLFTAIIN
jgi:hypothetical protein